MADVLKMPSSTLITEFLTEKGREVIQRMFYGFETAGAVTKFDGVNETLVLAEMQIVKDLIYEYNSTMSLARTEDAIEVTDVRLSTTDFKVELKAVVHDQQMKAYRAYLKGAGMTMDELHFVEYLIMASMNKMGEELEDGVWQAVLDTTPGNIGNRKFAARFNGYRKLALDAGVAGKATIVATGAVTLANAVEKINSIYRAAHKTMKKSGFNIYCSYTTFEDYQINYAATHQGREMPLEEVKRMQYTFRGVPITLGGGKTYLVPVAGMGDDDALIATRPEFLAYGFDYEGQNGEWDIQKHGWEHWMLNFFPVGVQILLKRAGFLIVNDQL